MKFMILALMICALLVAVAIIVKLVLKRVWSPKNRLITLSCAIVALICGVFIVKNSLDYVKIFQNNSPRYSKTYHSNGFDAYLERCYLLVTTPEESTLKVANAIAKELNTPCTVLPYGSDVAKIDSTRNMLFFITQGKSIKREEQKVPDYLKEILEKNRDFQARLPKNKTTPILANSPVIMINTAIGFMGNSIKVQKLMLPSLGASIDGYIHTNSLHRDSQIQLVAKDISDNLNDLLARYRTKNAVKIPNIKIDEPIVNELNLPLKNWKKISEGYDHKVYSFEIENYAKDFATISDELKSLGFSSGQKTLDMILYSNRKSNNENVVIHNLIEPSANNKFGGLNYSSPIALVIYQNSQWTTQKQVMSPETEELKNTNLKFFVISNGINSIKNSDEKVKLLEQFCAMDDLAIKDKSKILTKIAYDKNCYDLVKKEFIKIADYLAKCQDYQEFIPIFDDLFKIVANKQELYEIMQEKLNGRIDIIKLDASKENIYDFKYPLDDVKNFCKDLILEFDNNRYQKMSCRVYCHEKDGKLELIINNSTQHGYDNILYQAEIITFNAYSKDKLYSGSSMSFDYRSLDDDINNSLIKERFGNNKAALIQMCYIDVENRQLVVKIKVNEPKNK